MIEKSRKVNESQIDFLKPCPFCGSKDVEVDEREEGCGILCRNCGVWATSGWWWFNDSKDAIKLWNRRTSE